MACGNGDGEGVDETALEEGDGVSDGEGTVQPPLMLVFRTPHGSSSQVPSAPVQLS
jgi:hypothetical protein